MKFYLTTPEVAWTTIALVGVMIAVAVARIAFRNYLREAVEPGSLRYVVARAHLRRVLIRLLRLSLNLGAGIVSAFTPPPIRHSVASLEMVVVVVLVTQAALDTFDLLLDYAVAQRLYADRPLFAGLRRTALRLLGVSPDR